MNNMLILSLLLHATVLAAEDKEAVVFQKAVPEKGTIRITHKKASIQGAKAEEKLPSGVTRRYPDVENIYVISLTVKDGKSSKEIWRTKTTGMSKFYIGSDIKFLDAVMDDAENLVVAYRHSNGVFCSIITKAHVETTSGKTRIYEEFEALGRVAKTAAISGSLSKGDLTVEITLHDQKRMKFLWKDEKWLEEAPKPNPGQ